METFGRADQSLQAKTQPWSDVIPMNILSIIGVRARVDFRACAHGVCEEKHFFMDRWVLAQMAVKGLARPRCKRSEYWM